MRSAEDLMWAFRRWSRWVDKAALVVGFEAETKFVRDSDPTRYGSSTPWSSGAAGPWG